MCGRAVQKSTSVLKAASILGCQPNNLSTPNHDSSNQVNMSPGRSFVVFQKQYHSAPNSDTPTKKERDSTKNDAQFSTAEKVWGLITRKGTRNSPLPKGPSKHFSNLMFNARSETAAEKISFRNLIATSKSCVLPLDGYYEWKTPPKDTIGNDGKQPYFVHRSDGMPLFVAGLYTSVSTGHAEEDALHTFTMLTTSACPQLKWLHHRMPVLLWDDALVKKWISSPSSQLLEELAVISNSTAHHAGLFWHPVTKKMSNVQYHGMDSIAPVKLEKLPSIKSFFGKNKVSSTSNKDGNKTQKIKSSTMDGHLPTNSQTNKTGFKRSNLEIGTRSLTGIPNKKQKSVSHTFDKKETKPITNTSLSKSSLNSKSQSFIKSKTKRDITSYFKKR